MVKAAKYLVLVGGLMGLVAFFLPLASVEGQGAKVEASAFQIVRGVAMGEEAVDKASESPEATVMDKKNLSDVGDFFTKVKAFVYGIYAPALLIVLLGVIGVLKKKFGRGSGVLAVLFALVTLAVWGFLFMLAGEVNKDGNTKLALGLGTHLLLGTGILALVGGITNTFKPDYGFD